MANNNKKPWFAALMIFVLSLSPALAAERYVDGDLSGNWFDPDNSGHGIQIEVLDLSQAVIAWYAFTPEGNPLWLFGVGEIRGDTIEAALFHYRGTGFPPDYDPEQVEGELWGEVVFRQTGCDSGVVDYLPVDAAFTAGEIALERLTRMDGSRCRSASDFDQTVTWNLDAGATGFEALFLDYPDGEEAFYELESGHRALTGVWSQRSGFLLSGNNHSDDLMMVVMRPLDGLEPGQRYRIELEMQFATNVPSGCPGVGGSPGDSVYMRLGAATDKPGFELAGDGHRRATLDLGQQSSSGRDALSVGNMANGLDETWCGLADRPWQFKRVSTAGQGFEVTADENGRIWIYGLSDSAFEATSTWYLTEFSVRLDRLDSAASIAQVLECGRLGPAGGIAGGRDLQRLDLDPDAFPEAVCNDGTRGFLYFRPFEGEDNRDRWVIQLQGGGGCGNAEACFERWCSVDTNFGMQGMTAVASPAEGIKASGILHRRQDNPIGGYNQVFVRYCSSDSWGGDVGDVAVTAPHPVTGQDLTATLHFRGLKIVDAVLSTLRGDGVDKPVYTLDGGSRAMPDLDQAEEVILGGASAGGAGTIVNADRVGDVLRQHNPALEDYFVIIDSIFAPSMTNYDFSQTEFCTELGACDYESFWTWVHEAGGGAFRNLFDDTSCAAAHADALHLCEDSAHVVRHHITTPMLVRMGQTDSLLSGNQIDNGFLVDGQPLDLATFARLVREELVAIADTSNAEEGSLMTRPPAVFGPTCSKHETLSHGPSVFDTAILVDDTPLTMFELMEGWLAGGQVRSAVASTPAENVCP